MQGANFDANMQAAQKVHALAAERGLTAGQVALAWVLHQGEDIVPIPGTRRRANLELNAAGAEVTLSPAELDTLESALAQVAGPRYNQERMATVDR
jgi:aryl-alcohol dehydrogenase-like predicted oxidoreductase